ncbi:hypothetical protein LOC67_13505 [Stieleria sp. JC731]|nr:secretin N-terminal domain-containing protein [Stieleria sp. JC731]MCC9601568.1 hypothetical protein [Stieleria sp. JC731]
MAKLFAITWLIAHCHNVSAQSSFFADENVPVEVRQKLERKYDLDLRDSTLLESLFAIRDVCGINIVAGNEVTGTVNASFENTSVFDILDSLLIARGYGYRVVGSSLAVVPLDRLGDQLPSFETEILSLIENRAEDLLPSIDSLLSPEGRVHAIESSNSVVVIDYPKRIEKIRSHLDALELAAKSYRGRMPNDSLSSASLGGTSVPANPSAVVRVFRTQYVDAATISTAVNALLSETGRIAPIELENKLIVSDRLQNIEQVAAAIEQLDQPRPQVRIWAMIYDCSTDDLDRLGVNWNSSAASTAVDAATGGAAQSAVLNTVTSTVGTGTNGLLTITSLNDQFDLQSVIQALRTAGDSRLLADPNVVVMNHETAEIEIVTEVPYQQLTQGIDGGTIGTTEFREAGVTLNVVPHIADDGTIAMVVNPRFSLLTGFSETDNAPIIDRRETNTTVRVANGQTIVLGGLRQRTRISEQTAIPVIGTLPVVGKLFQHRSASTRESELLVFITPQIVGDHCVGSQRENCVEKFLANQVLQTPTDPIPFGIEAVQAEQKASQGPGHQIIGKFGSDLMTKDPYPNHFNWTSQHHPSGTTLIGEPELIEVDVYDVQTSASWLDAAHE